MGSTPVATSCQLVGHPAAAEALIQVRTPTVRVWAPDSDPMRKSDRIRILSPQKAASALAPASAPAGGPGGMGKAFGVARAPAIQGG